MLITALLAAALFTQLPPLTQPTPPAPATAPKPSPTTDALTAYLATPRDARKPIDQQPFAATPLSKADRALAADLLWADHLATLRDSRAAEWKAKSITLDGKTMRFDFHTFGEKPAHGRSLFISLHGGGGAPAAVNDQQWKNQINLYKPAEGVYLAPRAPTDNWNLWHEAHIDPLLDRIIQDAVALEDVDPDRVYLMGYSAGGDGVYQLAPRMADRFAAASMMAGHPNDASPLGLRNLPFAIHVGADDAAFKRNQVAREWGQKLDELQKSDPDSAHAYTHIAKLHEGRAHWMNLEDKEAVPWMAGFTRNPFPKRIVWHQDDVTHDRFYWLGVAKGEAKAGTDITASVQGQTITIDTAAPLDQITLYLSDDLLDTAQPITIIHGGKTSTMTVPAATTAAIWASIQTCEDRRTLGAAALVVPLKN